MEVPVPVDDFAVVDLVGVVGLGEDVLNHGARVYDALPHAIVLQRNQVVVLVIEAGGIEIIEGLVEPLYLTGLASALQMQALSIPLRSRLRLLVLLLLRLRPHRSPLLFVVFPLVLLFGEGLSDEFVPFGVGDLLRQQLVGDSVLVLLDNMRQQLFGPR